MNKILMRICAYLSMVTGIAYFKLRRRQKYQQGFQMHGYIEDSYNTSVNILRDKYKQIRRETK